MSIDRDGAIFEVTLDLVIGQLSESRLEVLVKGLLESLTHELVVGLDCVLDVFVLIVVKNQLETVQLILDVVLQLLVASKNVLVSIDETSSSQRVLHGDDLVATDETTDLNSRLHALYGRFNLFTEEVFTVLRHACEMD